MNPYLSRFARVLFALFLMIASLDATLAQRQSKRPKKQPPPAILDRNVRAEMGFRAIGSLIGPIRWLASSTSGRLGYPVKRQPAAKRGILNEKT